MSSSRRDHAPTPPGDASSVIDELLASAAEHAAAPVAAFRTPKPARRIAVVACMDARLDLFGILGLAPGDAHVIRNAGGVATDDVIRSRTISQRKLGTQEVILVHHTDCGMLTFTEDELHRDHVRGFVYDVDSGQLREVV